MYLRCSGKRTTCNTQRLKQANEENLKPWLNYYMALPVLKQIPVVLGQKTCFQPQTGANTRSGQPPADRSPKRGRLCSGGHAAVAAQYS